jgi:para-nitrobenzyl esterase
LPITVAAPPLDDDQQRLSDAMIAYWTSFAGTGQPSAPLAPDWPRFAPGSESTQSLLAPLPAPDTGFAADHHCALWDSLRS